MIDISKKFLKYVENRMIHKSLRTFKTDVDRYYFNKYKKYKYKYHMLRKNLYEHKKQV